MSSPLYQTGLQTRSLSLSRGARPVAANIDLSLAPGSITILRGANGSGKTTLLRALAGLLTPTAGAIALTNKTASSAPSAPECRQYGVFFGHANAIKDRLSVVENLKFWTQLYGQPATRLDDALSQLDLEDLRHRYTDTLSAGQKRRVGFCRVLIANKPIWLLDEPTASMDAHSITRLSSAITNHRDNGGCILIATHDAITFDDTKELTLSTPVARS